MYPAIPYPSWSSYLQHLLDSKMGIIPGAAATGFGNEEERLCLTLNTRTSGDSAGGQGGGSGCGLLKQEGWGNSY